MRIEGRVVVQFVVDENGQVVDPQIIRGIGGGCDEAALAAVKGIESMKKPPLFRLSSFAVEMGFLTCDQFLSVRVDSDVYRRRI